MKNYREYNSNYVPSGETIIWYMRFTQYEMRATKQHNDDLIYIMPSVLIIINMCEKFFIRKTEISPDSKRKTFPFLFLIVRMPANNLFSSLVCFYVNSIITFSHPNFCGRKTKNEKKKTNYSRFITFPADWLTHFNKTTKLISRLRS